MHKSISELAGVHKKVAAKCCIDTIGVGDMAKMNVTVVMTDFTLVFYHDRCKRIFFMAF